MTNSKKNIWLVHLVTAVLSLTVNSCNLEYTTLNRNTKTINIKNNSPAVEGKVEGELVLCNLNDSNISENSDIHQFPAVWLTFEKNPDFNIVEDVKVNLPQEAINIMLKHWKKLIDFRYSIKYKNNGQNNKLKLDADISQSTIDTKIELEKIKLDTPLGRRNISENEARELVTFLSNCSNKTIN